MVLLQWMFANEAPPEFVQAWSSTNLNSYLPLGKKTELPKYNSQVGTHAKAKPNKPNHGFTLSCPSITLKF